MSAPKYSAMGELVCGECGEVMVGGMSSKGDAVYGCTNCQKSYEVGSTRHNPAPEYRQAPRVFPNSPYGIPNYIVKDGKVQDGH